MMEFLPKICLSLILASIVSLASSQLSESNVYQPRYNPQYTNIQQNPSTTTQYDNPLLKSLTSEINSNELGVNKNVAPPTAYNSYLETNTLGAGVGGSNSDAFGRNYGNSNSFGFKGTSSGQHYSDLYSDEDNFCPEHWISFRQSCYRFVRSPKRNWLNAKNICAAYQANLVNVDSIEKHSFILQQLIMHNQKYSRYWISARQTGPNNWVNEDNTQLVALDDAFARDEDEFSFEDQDLHDNRFLAQRTYNAHSGYNAAGPSDRGLTQSQNNIRGFFGEYGIEHELWNQLTTVHLFSRLDLLR